MRLFEILDQRLLNHIRRLHEVLDSYRGMSCSETLESLKYTFTGIRQGIQIEEQCIYLPLSSIEDLEYHLRHAQAVHEEVQDIIDSAVRDATENELEALQEDLEALTRLLEDYRCFEHFEIFPAAMKMLPEQAQKHLLALLDEYDTHPVVPAA